MLTARTQIALAVEANAGTAETLVAGDVLLPTEIPEWEPDVVVTPRSAMTSSLSPRGSVVGSRSAKVRFKMFMRGTSVAPVQDTTFPDFRTPMLGCGVKDTVTTGETFFDPDTDLVEDEAAGGFLTVGLMRDGKQYLIHGAQGNCVMTFTVGQPVLLEFEFTGVYNPPTDVALFSGVTYPTVIEPAFTQAALSVLGHTAARISSLTLDMGNEVIMVSDPNDLTGFVRAQIVRRTPIGSFDAEEVLAATNDWFAEWISGASGSITTGVFPSGGTAENTFSLTVPASKYTKVGLADRDGMANAPIDYEAQANSDAGDDEWQLLHT